MLAPVAADRADNTAKPYETPKGKAKYMLSYLEEATDNYVSAILSSEEYRAYKRELEQVRQYPELKAQIDDFRKRNFEFQCSPDCDFDKLDRFEKEYENFRENPMVSDFLAAELDFCRLMQRLNAYVTAALQFE